ncbi:MAG: 50S ribosomal protein L25, partial [Bacillota bacterium]|nr:50S ribosomal protein L25 [Bacillota bacterium]
EHIEVDLNGLGIGSTITIADIDMNKYPGIEILEDADSVVATIVEPSKYDEAPAESSEEAVETEE